MSSRTPTRYVPRRITIKRFALGFALFELSMFLLGYGLDLMPFMGVFWISLILGPLIVFPFVLQANTRQSDAEFEAPVLWLALAFLCFIAFLFLAALGSVLLLRGTLDKAAYVLVIAAFVLFSSRLLYRSALERKHDWRLMREARRAMCPACGRHGPHKLDVCRSCGAIVFWVPSWLTPDGGPRFDDVLRAYFGPGPFEKP